MESLVGSQLDSLTVFEERYAELTKLLELCPSSLVVDPDMPPDEALRQHKRLFNQEVPEAVKSLQEVTQQLSQPDNTILQRLKQVRPSLHVRMQHIDWL